VAVVHFEDVRSWLAIAIGVYCFVAIVRALRKGRAVRQWARTTGAITRSEVKGGCACGWLFHWPDLTYDYEVAGRTHIGSKANMSWISTPSRAWAAGLKGRYPVGRTVDVWYDPADPEDCLLERTPALWGLVPLGLLAVLCLTIGGLGVLHVI